MKALPRDFRSSTDAARDPAYDAAREQDHCAAPDVEDDAHGRRKCRYGCPQRPKASGPVERLERVVQGHCAAT
jgi:hypothetical protein